MVGSDGNDNQTGATYVIYGGSTLASAGTINLADIATGTGGFKLVGAAAGHAALLAVGAVTVGLALAVLRVPALPTVGLSWLGAALAARLDPARVTVNSLHPATYMPAKMVLDSVGHSIDSLDTGVASTLRLIQDPALDGVTGGFYDRLTEARALPSAYDTNIQQRRWETSEQLTTLL